MGGKNYPGVNPLGLRSLGTLRATGWLMVSTAGHTRGHHETPASREH